MSQVEPSLEAAPPPMHLRRPQWLTRDIQDRFTSLQAQAIKDYTFNGDFPDYSFDDLNCTAMELVEDLERQQGRQLRILDIGAGAGAFVLRCLQRGHQAQALSAHPYKESGRFNTLTEQLPDEAYIVGDANCLDEIPELMDGYDLVVSRNTFFHLSDTLGTLEQAANRVAVGGIMAITGIDIEDSHFYPYREMSMVTAEHVLAGLAKGGFNTNRSVYDSSHAVAHRIATLCAQRQVDNGEARLAVGYRGGPNGWSYIPA